MKYPVLIQNQVWLYALSLFLFISCTDESESEVTDTIGLIDGLSFEVIVRASDPISDLFKYGYDNDDISIIEETDEKIILAVGHEDINPLFVSNYDFDGEEARHRKQINQEVEAVGLSIIKLQNRYGSWKLISGQVNSRINGADEIPFQGDQEIAGKRIAHGIVATGPLAKTPWGTLLIAESHYEKFYGDYDYEIKKYVPSRYQWESFLVKSTKHYGWIVELNPKDGSIYKHINPGRMARGGLVMSESAGDKLVLYFTDNIVNGCLFKYESSRAGQLSPGKLSVANMDNFTWNPIDFTKPIFADTFSTETEMYVRARDAARLVAGTPFKKPSGLAINPLDQSIVMTLEGDSTFDLGGLIWLKDNEDKPGKFELIRWLDGSLDSKIVNPDHVTFDNNGNLWFTSNVNPKQLNQAPYENFFQNGLYILKSGQSKAVRVATAPNDAAFGGLRFVKDGSALFVTVKHPGQLSTPTKLTSHWPGDEGATPLPSLVVITGDYLEDISVKDD